MILFGLAFSFLDPSTVMPSFVGELTNSDVLIGLSSVMFGLGWRLPQLLLAPLVNRAPRKLPWMLYSSIPGRMAFIVVAALIVFIGPSHSGVLLLIFFGGYLIFAMCDGVATISWSELIGNAVPERTRGFMFSTSQIFTALSVLVVQGALRALLGPKGPGFPENYAIVFAIAGGLLTISLPIVALLYEAPVPPTTRITGIADYLPYLRKVVSQDATFRRFLLLRSLLDASALAIPFYIGYEINQLQVPTAQAVSDSLIAVMIGNVIGSALSGWIGGRFGSRIVIWLQITAMVTGPVAALLSGSLGREVLLISFATIGLTGAANGSGLFNWVVAHAPVGERATYNSISNTLGLVSLIVPSLIGGILLQSTSYTVLFVVALGTSVITAVVGAGLKRPGQPLLATPAVTIQEIPGA
jgi:MFS family permease